MPTSPHALLSRLNDIAQVVAQTGHALALLGLGSVGRELARLDRWSDLDFFVIARPGQVGPFLDSAWLAQAAPLAYTFRNTPDGAKVLFGDGLYAEYAAFEAARLPELPLAGARVVWAAPDFSGLLPEGEAALAGPITPAQHAHHLGEALTNLLVGLGRYGRGERLSALKFVQDYALGHVLALEAARGALPATGADPFSPERRLEARAPGLAARLPAFTPGYAGTPQAALALLAHLEAHEPVPPALSRAIRAAAQAAGD
ncbi:hypothetical protein [Deinococcus arcticus]|uniref:Nucleotidyltransferase domain-containing protein n=1 Tax=Deinococcus arcticus TaxID=2136176 RepID=A0A2T3WCY8_9DEIO|nr:hypothetical protein [Deinococcus arcticus]PTA69737.1 hypothetical protein C8263_01610 [Deinococcus arcticus]